MKAIFLKTTALVLFGVLVCLPAAVATETSDATDAEEEAASEMQTNVAGTVISVDQTLRTMVVKDEQRTGEIYNMFMNDDTSFAGEAESLSEITPGDRVTIDYYAFQGSNIATTVTLEEQAYQEEGKTRIDIKKVLSG